MGTNPVGIADRIPAPTAPSTAVTKVGMVATLALLVLAAGLATYRLDRFRDGGSGVVPDGRVGEPMDVEAGRDVDMGEQHARQRTPLRS